MTSRAARVAAALQLCFPAAQAVHYFCSLDEVKGEVQGETGVVCGPRCADGNFQCPTDVPEGTSAQPQCMLQDVDQTSYCGLLCQVDSQCPSGASCRKVSGPIEVSICIHPLSFDEWAKTAGARRKLTVGWPTKAGAQQSGGGYQIAKAYSALQSLKHRYGINDGDADVLTVKELLSAVSSAGVASARAPAAAAAWPDSPAGAPPATQAPAPSQWHPALAAPRSANQGGFMGGIEHDLSYAAGNIAMGPVAGLEKEIHDTVWNVEHFEKYGVCTDMLRSVVLCALFYLVAGAAYKNQTLGATGIDMIPHVGFWKEYPQLVLDGVQYATGMSADFFGTGSRGFEPLSGGVSEKQSFSNLGL